MEKLTIELFDDFRAENVAVYVEDELLGNGFGKDEFDVLYDESKNSIEVYSDSINLSRKFLDIISDITDGYRKKIY